MRLFFSPMTTFLGTVSKFVIFHGQMGCFGLHCSDRGGVIWQLRKKSLGELLDNLKPGVAIAGHGPRARHRRGPRWPGQGTAGFARPMIDEPAGRCHQDPCAKWMDKPTADLLQLVKDCKMRQAKG